MTAQTKKKQVMTFHNCNLNSVQDRQAFLDYFTEQLLAGKAPKEIFEFPDDFLENLYATAYQFFTQNNHREAGILFDYLIQLDPTCYKYYFGLAASLHQMKQYLPALSAYTLAMAREPKNPLPFYYAADCFLQEKDKDTAITLLKDSIELAGNHKEHAAIKEKAKLILKALKKNA